MEKFGYNESIYKTRKEGGSNGLEKYEKIFAFKAEELKGMTVLDLGAGLKNEFANDIKKAGVKTDVVSLSPEYKKPYVGRQALGSRIYDAEFDFFSHPLRHAKELLKENLGFSREFKEAHKKVVAGIGQQLPFKDEVFDREYASHVFEHMPGRIKDDFSIMMGEMARTLKKGGVAKIGPISEKSFPKESLMIILVKNQGLQETLSKYNAVLESEDISGKFLARKTHADGTTEEVMVDASTVGAYNLVLKKY